MKIKLLLSTIILLILTTFSFAADQVNVVGYTPFAHETITVTTLAVSQLDATYAATAGAVFITVETNNIRYWIDGGIPTTAIGHPVVSAAYQNLWFNDPMSIKEFRAIAVGGNSTLSVTYYRRN
jgi:hypothetical protein